MVEQGAVVSKQQLSDAFLNGFRACEETAICSETDVDALWQALFCLPEHCFSFLGHEVYALVLPLSWDLSSWKET